MEKIGKLIAKIQMWFAKQKEDYIVKKSARQYKCIQIMDREIHKLYALEVFRQCYCDRERTGIDYCYYRNAYDRHLKDIKAKMYQCLSELEAFNPENCKGK